MSLVLAGTAVFFIVIRYFFIDSVVYIPINKFFDKHNNANEHKNCFYYRFYSQTCHLLFGSLQVTMPFHATADHIIILF